MASTTNQDCHSRQYGRSEPERDVWLALMGMCLDRSIGHIVSSDVMPGRGVEIDWPCEVDDVLVYIRSRDTSLLG